MNRNAPSWVKWIACILGVGGAGFVLGLLYANWTPLPGFAVNAAIIFAGAVFIGILGVRAVADSDRAGSSDAATTSRESGFTLIELLVVVAIIALLLGIMLPALGMARRASEVSGSQQFMRTLSMAIETYSQDHQMYPPSDFLQSGVDISDRKWQGGEILTQALVGHLLGDGKDGDGFKVGPRTYGPYVEVKESEDFMPRWDKNGDGSANGEYWNKTTIPKTTSAFVFADYWAGAICYYRADIGGSSLWAVGGRFDPLHNSIIDMDSPVIHDSPSANSSRFVLYSAGPDGDNKLEDDRSDDIVVYGP